MFTIDADNNITYYPGELPAGAEGLAFNSEAQLTKLSTEWPLSRLVQIWNDIPGAKQVKKFENRTIACKRIWAAVKAMAARVDEEDARAAETPKSRKQPKWAAEAQAKKKEAADRYAEAQAKQAEKDVAQAEQAEKQARATKRAAQPAPTAADSKDSKKARAVELMSRPGGATLDQLVTEFGWQRHTVRGFISLLQSKHGVKINSSKTEAGRTYEVAR